jgi:hypothetical protein
MTARIYTVLTWQYVTHLDAFRSRIPSGARAQTEKASCGQASYLLYPRAIMANFVGPLNSIMKKMYRCKAYNNLTSLVLFPGSRPMWVEPRVYKELATFTNLTHLGLGTRKGGLEYVQDADLVPYLFLIGPIAIRS